MNRKLLFTTLCIGLALLTCACAPANLVEATTPEAVTDSTSESIELIEPSDAPVETEVTLPTMEGVPLTDAEIAGLMKILTDAYSWYPTILKFTFDSPMDVDCYGIFCNGTPLGDSFEPTEAERAYLTGLYGENYFRLEVDYIDRSVMYEVLRTYFGLTDEEIATLSMEGLTYMEETDRYYSDQNSANTTALLIRKGYILPNGMVSIYFCDYNSYRMSGSFGTKEYRAVFRWEEDHCVFLSNELIYDPYAP